MIYYHPEFDIIAIRIAGNLMDFTDGWSRVFYVYNPDSWILIGRL